jgi:hypothetical protein
MGDTKTMFCSSNPPGGRHRISSKFIKNLDTRPQKRSSALYSLDCRTLFGWIKIRNNPDWDNIKMDLKQDEDVYWINLILKQEHVVECFEPRNIGVRATSAEKCHRPGIITRSIPEMGRDRLPQPSIIHQHFITRRHTVWAKGRDSSVGIATTLRAGRSEDRIPVEARLSEPVQNGPEAHPASYTMGTGSFARVMRPGRGDHHPPHLTPRLKKEYSDTSIPPWAFVACSGVNITFTVCARWSKSLCAPDDYNPDSYE